jgi:RNA polymerase sigma-70 factor (ECF subfamily)
MEWLDFALRLLRPAPERDPARTPLALLPRFDAEGRWAEPAPRLSAGLLPAAERDARVRRAIDALPELYRVVILVCDVEGLSREEAAAGLGIPLGAVKLRLHRARQALLTLLGPQLAPRLH